MRRQMASSLCLIINEERIGHFQGMLGFQSMSSGYIKFVTIMWSKNSSIPHLDHPEMQYSLLRWSADAIGSIKL